MVAFIMLVAVKQLNKPCSLLILAPVSITFSDDNLLSFDDVVFIVDVVVCSSVVPGEMVLALEMLIRELIAELGKTVLKLKDADTLVSLVFRLDKDIGVTETMSVVKVGPPLM